MLEVGHYISFSTDTSMSTATMLTEAETEAIMGSPLFDILAKNATGKNYTVGDAWKMAVRAYYNGVVEASAKYKGIIYLSLEEGKYLQDIAQVCIHSYHGT